MSLVLATDLPLLLMGGSAAQSSSDPANVGIEVLDALSQSTTAPVIIFLEMPAIPAEQRARRMEEVARVQGEVRETLEARTSKFPGGS